MDHPVKTAACPLYFRSNGGWFTALGLPILGGRLVELVTEETEVDDEGNLVLDQKRQYGAAALLCDKAYDCGACPLLRQWIAGEESQGWTASWECFICLHDSWKYEKDNSAVERNLAGFYQAGRDPDLKPGDEDYDADRYLLQGCSSCGRGSSLLQLVLRRAR